MLDAADGTTYACGGGAMGSIGVRGYLFAMLGVSTALPVLWFGNDQAAQFDAEVRARHDESLAVASDNAAGQVGQFVESRKRDLEVLAATVEALGELKGERVERLLDAHWRATGYYAGTYIGDAQGNALERAPKRGEEEDDGRQHNYSDRDYYRKLIATQRTAVSRVQSGRWLTGPHVQIAAPIWNADKSLQGYAEGSVQLEGLVSLLQHHTHDSVQRMVLVDASNTIVVDSTQPDASLTDVTAHPLFELRAPRGTLRTDVDLNRTPTRGAVAGISSLPGWRVVALQPQAAIDRLAAGARNRVWWAAGIATLLALGASALLSTWLSRRLQELERTLRAVGRGVYPRARLSNSRWEPRELQRLQGEIEKMAAKLAERRRSLEDLVDERTAELAQVNQRLQILVNALERAEDGIEITNCEAEYLYVNPAVVKITGYEASELLGNTPSVLRSGLYDEAFYQRIWQQLQAGEVYSGTFTAKRKDGRVFEQELTVWPIKNAEGRIAHFVSLRRDVTEKRRTEEALRLSERMASLGTIAAGVAHEINNPLTYVLLSLRMVQKQLDRHALGLPAPFLNRTGAAVENAIDGANRVSSIVKDLRGFSRSDEETIEPVDPRAVLDSALRLVGNDIRHKAKLVRDYGSVPQVACNHAKLHQVFLNLFVNAAHAIEQVPSSEVRRGEIHVCTKRGDDGGAVIELSDTGIGIPPQHLDRIFEPFFTTKPVGVGTGLGLAMCRNLLRGMGGEVSVESEVGRGSTFRICLPAAPSTVTSPPASSQTERRRRTPSLRVLIIDDDRAVAESMRNALSERHEVETADSGHDALRLLTKRHFDVLVCDIMMPGMNGLEFYQRLRAEAPGLEQRLIFVTAGALTQATRSFLNNTCTPWLEKPLSEEQLENALTQLTNSALDFSVSAGQS